MNPIQSKGNRTFICSVVFIDIVEYTRKAVTEQIQLKEQLNAFLGEALKDVAASDRIILDTGDGAAISFVGDPEDALFVCLSLRNAVAEQEPSPSALSVRIGINLGPVKLIRDLNGLPNIIGDGINVAQRIMGFAEPNQILVSRSYFEVVSCLSETYAKLFHYEGSRTDKHVREHEVYAVGDGAGEIRRTLEAAHAATGSHAPLSVTQSVVDQLSSTTTRLRENLRAQPRIGTGIAVVAILALAMGMRGLRDRAETPREARAPSASVVTKSALPLPGEKSAGVPAPVGNEPVAAAPAPAEQSGAMPPQRVVEPVPLAASGKPGFLAFAITPWGEIYVDGRKLGVSPPLQELQLSPGWYKIEVRNTTFTAHVQTVEVRPGERLRIMHRFR